MSLPSNWMQVGAFTVDQAAALWCGVDPATIRISFLSAPSEVQAAKQMLTAAISMEELKANSSNNVFAYIGDYSHSLVSRHDLEEFARRRKIFPAFLFDTMAPFDALPNEPTGQAQFAPVAAPKGGRPQEYDWDSFMLEIIRRANLPDGLPERQAELIRDMLQWFNDGFGAEPAESSVKSRVSRIYKYLREAKNPSA